MLSVDSELFTLLGYPVSAIELTGTFFGLVSVFLAARNNIFTWPAGIINQICFFVIFFQVQIYGDMLLQVYFFGMTVYGWMYWHRPENRNRITTSSRNYLTALLVILALGTITLGFLLSRIHILLPDIFIEPAAFPFPDAFSTSASILAMLLMAQKRIECWFLWIAVDTVSIGLYIAQDVLLIAIQYFVFMLICISGYRYWKRDLVSDTV